MIPDTITTPEEAVSHLFLHCCFKDGTVTEGEIKNVSEKLVATGLNKELNFTDVVLSYKSYGNSLNDEAVYLEKLVALIRPVNSLALFSYCIELCLSDGLLQPLEEELLQRLAAALKLDDRDQSVCKKLMLQRNVVEKGKIF